MKEFFNSLWMSIMDAFGAQYRVGYLPLDHLDRKQNRPWIVQQYSVFESRWLTIDKLRTEADARAYVIQLKKDIRERRHQRNIEQRRREPEWKKYFW